MIKGCPVGSIIVGPADLISLARRYRKLFGGAMRQIGMLAACSAYALSHHISLLPVVHQKARKLAERMHGLGITIKKPVDTCMVWFDPSPLGLNCEDIAERALKLDKPITMFAADRLVVCLLSSGDREATNQ
jgi:threonine aldolase